MMGVQIKPHKTSRKGGRICHEPQLASFDLALLITCAIRSAITFITVAVVICSAERPCQRPKVQELQDKLLNTLNSAPWPP
jgi:hypothetical protein